MGNQPPPGWAGVDTKIRFKNKKAPTFTHKNVMGRVRAVLVMLLVMLARQGEATITESLYREISK
jgi:hypothetical protein